MSKDKKNKQDVANDGAAKAPVRPAGPTAGLKPISGGLQPVIAPKGQVQLAPIVVPVAFVPYGTQNQPMLQYEKEKRVAPEITDQPLDSSVAADAKRKKKGPKFVAAEVESTENKKKKNKLSKGAARGVGFVSLIMSLLYLAPFVLTYVAPDMEFMKGTVKGLGFPNVIDMVIKQSFTDNLGTLLFGVACVFGIINLLFSLIAIIAGKNPKLGVVGVFIFVANLAASWITGVAQVLIFSGNGSGLARLFIVSLLLMIIQILYAPKKVKDEFAEEKPKKGKKAKKEEMALAE